MRLFVAFCTFWMCCRSVLTLSLNATAIPDSLTLDHGSLPSPLNWFPVCVDPDQHPTWSSSITPLSCAAALFSLKGFVHPFGETPYTFYSREFVKGGAKGDWGLPSVVVYGDCALVLRMVIDFGDDVLPLRTQGYFNGSSRQPTEVHDWHDILIQLEILTKKCIWQTSSTAPGWARVGNSIIVLLLPTNSEMRKQWAPLAESTMALTNPSRYLSTT